MGLCVREEQEGGGGGARVRVDTPCGLRSLAIASPMPAPAESAAAVLSGQLTVLAVRPSQAGPGVGRHAPGQQSGPTFPSSISFGVNPTKTSFYDTSMDDTRMQVPERLPPAAALTPRRTHLAPSRRCGHAPAPPPRLASPVGADHRRDHDVARLDSASGHTADQDHRS
jgi:hypothetical protein